MLDFDLYTAADEMGTVAHDADSGAASGSA
jgi:hypothetical protein